MGHKLGQIPTIPHQFQSNRKKVSDQCAVVLLIYQSFSISPVRVELIPRITRFILSQLKNGLCLEFSALCEQTSLEISTDTRLPKQTRLTGALMVCSRICSWAFMRTPYSHELQPTVELKYVFSFNISYRLISLQRKILRLYANLPYSKEYFSCHLNMGTFIYL